MTTSQRGADLPAGWTDEQDGGHYRLVRRDDDALFGYAVGPESWKRFLHPPRLRLWQAQRSGEEVTVKDADAAPERFAFIGVRSCELHAMAIQDRVFLGDSHKDHHYEARREGAFLVAVNCGQAGGTCFCVSMGTGPAARDGFDLALTELLDGGDHRFVAEAGTEAGREVLAGLPQRAATDDDVAAADGVVRADGVVHGAPDAYGRSPRPAACQSGPSALGRGRRSAA